MKQINLKKDDVIKLKFSDEEAWSKVKIIARAVKKSKKRSDVNWFNVKNLFSGEELCINLDSTSKWKKINSRTSILRLNNLLSAKNIIENDWVNPKSGIYFSGISKIYDHLKTMGVPCSKESIKQILASFSTYSKFKEHHLPRNNNVFYIYKIHWQWQMDLCYFSDLHAFNDGVKYLLVVIECFSRKIFIAVMKDKKSETTVQKFDSIHRYVGFKPVSLYVDRGSEFFSELFKIYCQNNGIKIIYSTSSTKAAIVERAQRTLQSIIYKYMNHYSTKRYIDGLDEIVTAFNSKVNRTIGLSPNNAYKAENHEYVMKKHEVKYKKILSKKRKPSYRVNDKVRIIRLSQPSMKIRSYQQSFTSEIFRIVRIDTRLPLPRYYLRDANDEPVIGSFADHELSLSR